MCDVRVVSQLSGLRRPPAYTEACLSLTTMSSRSSRYSTTLNEGRIYLPSLLYRPNWNRTNGLRQVPVRGSLKYTTYDLHWSSNQHWWCNYASITWSALKNTKRLQSKTLLESNGLFPLLMIGGDFIKYYVYSYVYIFNGGRPCTFANPVSAYGLRD